MTTMRVNIAELGGLAVTRLLAAIESAEHQVHAPQILVPELIVRASSIPARSRKPHADSS